MIRFVDHRQNDLQRPIDDRRYEDVIKLDDPNLEVIVTMFSKSEEWHLHVMVNRETIKGVYLTNWCVDELYLLEIFKNRFKIYNNTLVLFNEKI